MFKNNTTTSEVFKIIDDFFNENDILWENCVRICKDGASSMAGKNASLQALVQKGAPCAVWTY